ncbi:uncharacterized protein LOC125509453 isoform X2 [Triticum urartu]|uniref:uncharacterized protein LOC125509453 isoform X2 n=1 Tax=Triticum urartu TaxID=4572 RepID=UPI00204408DF|nr:uncharacterized protein LOC125509453 isoform X2 [Triticum urartu]
MPSFCLDLEARRSSLSLSIPLLHPAATHPLLHPAATLSSGKVAPSRPLSSRQIAPSRSLSSRISPRPGPSPPRTVPLRQGRKDTRTSWLPVPLATGRLTPATRSGQPTVGQLHPRRTKEQEAPGLLVWEQAGKYWVKCDAERTEEDP